MISSVAKETKRKRGVCSAMPPSGVVSELRAGKFPSVTFSDFGGLRAVLIDSSPRHHDAARRCLS